MELTTITWFTSGFFAGWMIVVVLMFHAIEKKTMNIQEAVAAVEAAVTEVAAGVAAVQSGVAQVIEDLQGAGANQETIDKLHDAAIQLGTIATNANTAAQTLRDADPTPPESETPNSVPDPAE